MILKALDLLALKLDQWAIGVHHGGQCRMCNTPDGYPCERLQQAVERAFKAGERVNG